MVSIMPYDYNVINEAPQKVSILPEEVIDIICKYLNMVVKKDETGFSIYNSHNMTLIKKIDTFPLFHISVSKCGKYVVGSNEQHVCIWNICNSLMVKSINIDFSPVYDTEGFNLYHVVHHQSNGEPVHTFTADNELLIAYNRNIDVYHLVDNEWTEKKTYNLSDISSIISKIVCITASSTTNTFAVGDLYGQVCIYNLDADNISVVYSFSTIPQLFRTDYYLEIMFMTITNNFLIVTSKSKENFIVDLNTMSRVKIITPQHVGCFFGTNYLLTPCGTKIIGSCTNFKHTYMWDALSGAFIKRLDIYIGENSVFTPNGKKIISNILTHTDSLKNQELYYGYEYVLNVFNWE